MKRFLKPLIFLMICTVLLSGCAGDTEETFRSAKVISVTGTALLVREGISMDVYEGLVLQSGDQLKTAEGRVDLKLDEDKYVVLEANTIVVLELEGDPQKGAIRLHQTLGTIHHTIENPLSEADSYEVHTPDAVMSVRGTEFSTSVSYTEDGTTTTTEVGQGEVEMTPNNSQDPSQRLGPGSSAAAGTDNGGPSHFLIYCKICGQKVEALDSHRLSCGEAHYSCDSQNHSVLPCGHLACAGDDHKSTLPCGHLVCSEEDHSSTFPCGHYTCLGGEHDRLPCGHFACAEGDHSKTYGCGHYVCKGGNHGKRSCGHYVCKGGNHGKRSCGHYVCKGGNHGKLSCGHHACQGGSHGKLDCGHYACNTEDLDHEQASCGAYPCQGGTHSRCYVCGSCTCTGDHSELPCGHLQCEDGSHDPLACGHYTCASGNHALAACGSSGHYVCDGQVHDAYYPCNFPLCTSGHSQMSCGHCPTCDSALDHTALGCGGYACKDGHSLCGFCGQCTCTGTHGDGSCNVTG